MNEATGAGLDELTKKWLASHPQQSHELASTAQELGFDAGVLAKGVQDAVARMNRLQDDLGRQLAASSRPLTRSEKFRFSLGPLGQYLDRAILDAATEKSFRDRGEVRVRLERLRGNEAVFTSEESRRAAALAALEGMLDAVHPEDLPEVLKFLEPFRTPAFGEPGSQTKHSFGYSALVDEIARYLSEPLGRMHLEEPKSGSKLRGLLKRRPSPGSVWDWRKEWALLQGWGLLTDVQLDQALSEPWAKSLPASTREFLVHQRAQKHTTQELRRELRVIQLALRELNGVAPDYLKSVGTSLFHLRTSLKEPFVSSQVKERVSGELRGAFERLEREPIHDGEFVPRVLSELGLLAVLLEERAYQSSDRGERKRLMQLREEVESLTMLYLSGRQMDPSLASTARVHLRRIFEHTNQITDSGSKTWDETLRMLQIQSIFPMVSNMIFLATSPHSTFAQVTLPIWFAAFSAPASLWLTRLPAKILQARPKIRRALSNFKGDDHELWGRIRADLSVEEREQLIQELQERAQDIQASIRPMDEELPAVHPPL